MATTTTSKIAEAISLLSDVLSKEVATTQHFDEDSGEFVPAEDHDDLKSLAEDFATDTQISLEEVQGELQALVDAGDDDIDYAWDSEYDDDDEYDEDSEEPDDPGNGEVDISDAEDDDTEPTDGEKIDMLVAAGAELEEKIDEQEQTIEDLKNTIRSVLDNVSTLIDATHTFNDALDDA